MSIEAYLEFACLEDNSFALGSYQELEFDVYDADGVALDISSALSIVFNMGFFGQEDFNILTKAGSITATNTFEIILDGSDTVSLEEGRYSFQTVITDFSGKVFIPAQGDIILLPKISST